MNLNPFRTPSTSEHRAMRRHAAQKLADYHSKRTAEMKDAVEWALAQEQHHARMATMYATRAKTLQEDACISTAPFASTVTSSPDGTPR